MVFLLFFTMQVMLVSSQNVDDGNTTASSSKVDIDDSVFTNLNLFKEEGQGFFLSNNSFLYEKPGTPVVSLSILHWFSDFEFLSGSSHGYVGRSVIYFLGSSLEDAIAEGAQIPGTETPTFPYSVSAVLLPAL